MTSGNMRHPVRTFHAGGGFAAEGTLMNEYSPGEKKPDILIVDDTPANLNLLCEIIRGQGLKARPVPSGALALAAAAASPPDLILLDIDMPELTGFEVCQRLKADPALAEIPVIFISALTAITDKVRGFEVGGVDYVPKPFQQEEVIARVRAHLELRRQRREIQRAYGRLRELEQLRANLVNMVVHDLRSPLSAICSLLYSVKTEPNVPEQAIEDAEGALAAAMEMSTMITSVLELNKIEDGAMRLELADCDLVALVGEVMSELRGIIGGRVIELTASAPSIVQAIDKELIVWVLQNLLSNALKFASRCKNVQINIESGQDCVRTSVADDGPGIPREYHQKIFEKSGQAEARRSRLRNSTGLGLSFCKHAVEAHGGAIGVNSDSGRVGNTFWFTLPRKMREAT